MYTKVYFAFLYSDCPTHFLFRYVFIDLLAIYSESCIQIFMWSITYSVFCNVQFQPKADVLKPSRKITS